MGSALDRLRKIDTTQATAQAETARQTRWSGYEAEKALPAPQARSRGAQTKVVTSLPTAGKVSAGRGLAMLPTAADLSAGQPANTTAFDIDPATVGTRSAPIVGLPNADQRIGLAAGSIGQTLAAAPAVAIDTWKQYVKNSKVQGAVGLTDDYLDLEKERSALANRMDYMERYQYPTRAAARESKEYQALSARREEISAELARMVEDAGGNSPVSMDSKGMQRMTQAMETREKALEGMTGAPRWLAEQGISIGQNLALLPTAFINPSAPLIGMGAISAGDKMYELNAQGKSPDEALGRGLVAGGIEAATEKIPLDTLMSVVKTGGKSALKNLLKQAGVEAGEESLSYVMNFIADKGAKDPNASFSLPELASAAAGGAFSGLVMGGLGTAGNRMSGYLPRAGEARMGQELQPLPKAGETGKSQPATLDQQVQKTASTGEAESTAVNTDPAQHTPAEQAIIKEYQSAVDENLVDFYNAAKNEATAKKGAKPYLLKPVSERTSTDILNLTGVDTSGFETRFDVKQANHIFLDHGEDGRADHSMADAHDIGRIQYVLDYYDHADAWGTTGAYWETTAKGRNRQAKTVLLSKKVNGTYYVVEATPDTKARSVYIVSAYMLEEGKLPPGNAGKNTTGATSQLTDAQRPQRNGQTATANVSPVSAPIITDSTAGGNTQSAQNAGGVTGAGPLPRAGQAQGGMQYLPRAGEVQTDMVTPPVESQFDYVRKAQEVQKNGIFTGEYRRAFERSGLKHEDAEAALAKIAGGDTGRGDPDVRRVMDILDGSDGRSGTYARSGQVITGRDPLPRAGEVQGVRQPLPRAGEAQVEPGAEASVGVSPEDSTGAAPMGFDRYSHLQNQKGEFHPDGENAARQVDVPTTDLEGRRIPKSTATVMESGNMTDEAVVEVQRQIADGTLSFTRNTDKGAMARAERTVREIGWDGAVERFHQESQRGVVSKDNMALGATLLVNSAQNGDIKTFAGILADYTSMSRAGAQATQANRLLKKMSPEGQLYAVQRMVENLNSDIRERGGGGTGGNISDDELGRVLEVRDTALDLISSIHKAFSKDSARAEDTAWVERRGACPSNTKKHGRPEAHRCGQNYGLLQQPPGVRQGVEHRARGASGEI